MNSNALVTLRRLATFALGVAFAHVVFGALVRITGSGMGCGEHWPDCQGRFFPPLDRLDLVIEYTHRLLASALILAVFALWVFAYRWRAESRVGGRGGVLRSASLAFGLVIVAALFGGLTVMLSLGNPYVTVVHLGIAMALLATLVIAAMRAGGFGAQRAVRERGRKRTVRGIVAAAVIALIVVLLGGLTAHIPGANSACWGFPGCSRGMTPGSALGVQLTHRILAYLLFLHSLGLLIGVSRRRDEAPIVRKAVRIAFASIVLQVIVAAAMVEMALPPVLRSLHEAVGTLVWLTFFGAAALAMRAARLPTWGSGDTPLAVGDTDEDIFSTSDYETAPSRSSGSSYTPRSSSAVGWQAISEGDHSVADATVDGDSAGEREGEKAEERQSESAGERQGKQTPPRPRNAVPPQGPKPDTPPSGEIRVPKKGADAQEIAPPAAAPESAAPPTPPAKPSSASSVAVIIARGGDF